MTSNDQFVVGSVINKDDCGTVASESDNDSIDCEQDVDARTTLRTTIRYCGIVNRCSVYGVILTAVVLTVLLVLAQNNKENKNRHDPHPSVDDNGIGPPLPSMNTNLDYNFIERFHSVRNISLFYQTDGSWDQAVFIDSDGCINVIDYVHSQTYDPICTTENSFLHDVTSLSSRKNNVIVAQNGTVSVWTVKDTTSTVFELYFTLSHEDYYASGFAKQVLLLQDSHEHDGQNPDGTMTPTTLLVASDDQVFLFRRMENGWEILTQTWNITAGGGFDVSDDHTFIVLYDEKHVQLFNLSNPTWDSDTYEPTVYNSTINKKIISATVTGQGGVHVVTQNDTNDYTGIAVTDCFTGYTKQFDMPVQLFGDVIVLTTTGQIYSVRSLRYISIELDDMMTSSKTTLLDIQATPFRVSVVMFQKNDNSVSTTTTTTVVADIYENHKTDCPLGMELKCPPTSDICSCELSATRQKSRSGNH